jgi:cell division protein FtsX
MRENLSLLSFWGLVFSLIAVTLFVVIYSYQKSKYANREIVEDQRQRSVDVYLAAKTPEAESDSKRFREASNEIERLRAETRALQLSARKQAPKSSTATDFHASDGPRSF